MAHVAPAAGERPDTYYVPEGSNWPWIGMIALAIMMTGGFLWLNDMSIGAYGFFAGVGLIIIMMIGWFTTVVRESKGNLYSPQMDQTFRIAMAWFIFSEVMFFAAFFGAYYFIRTMSGPCAAGEGSDCLGTHLTYFPGFEFRWTETGNGPGNLGANLDTGKLFAMAAMGDFSHGLKGFLEHSLPLLNTLILLTSGLTLTYAHHAIFKRKNGQVIIGLALTVLLGFSFLSLQALEYYEAYAHYGLTIESGGYGAVFYMTTGFHGVHVLIGTIMLTIQLFMAIGRYHSPERHFGFEATAWYWHFVDVVWLGLFIFLYIL